MSAQQKQLFDDAFRTARPPNPVFCHQDFLEKLEANRNLPIAKRAALLMQRLAVDSARQHYKSTQGLNQGWRRSRLGGTGGSHFYAWWAPKSAAPLKSGEGFREAPDGAVFLRDIRHHDDHSQAHPHSFHSHYLPVSVKEMKGEEYGPAPWTTQQLRFATSRQPVRVLKGHPGSGKTTALLHAVDASGARRVLYLTYSRDLAVLAREYFEKFCSDARSFQVLTFESFLRQLTRTDAPHSNYAELRHRFRSDLVPYTRSLGPWSDRQQALYDEMHAHLVGTAIPVACGRFPASKGARVTDKEYRRRRGRFLGEPAAAACADLASRLERSGQGLAQRYFPELALAWKAASALALDREPSPPPEFLEFDCIAVDECQDLTALESFVVVELASVISRRSRLNAPLFLAGDEAQTVRPTDFEWAWMNDILHNRLTSPAEFKLGANLRSPRSIAALVNRVWDLYGEIEKRDRPSGTGFAEIDDDSTDQVLYCTASKGPELDALLTDLAAREGLAMVCYDEAVREAVPASVRSSILTAAEVKGLDFHTVCLINAGSHLDRIVGWHTGYRFSTSDIESIRRRLAIDELRVGISRPADRLIWLDIAPTQEIVRSTTSFLNRSLDHPVAPSVPSALMTALQEEQLDIEERIQRCQTDARQYLAVKPELAWSRAQQAVALLGESGSLAAVQDPEARKAAYATLTEISFCLAFRKVQLPPELGRPDLFAEAAGASREYGDPMLPFVIGEIGRVMRADHMSRLPALGDLAQTMARAAHQLPAWMLTEIAAKVPAWLDELESAVPVGDNAYTLTKVLPPFYEVLRLPDAEARTARLLERCIRLLLKNKRHAEAIEVLQSLPERRPEAEAECLEALGRNEEAAALYQSMGKLKEALACYRAIPDFDRAAAMIRELPEHPASESYEWLLRLKGLLAERPGNFNKVMTAPEKKILEKMLEQGLGVARKTPAPRKAAVKKAPAKRAAAGQRKG
ncbi:MAG: hypothetical protein ACK5AZ_16060 [Bryobacteraceae bacterium]